MSLSHRSLLLHLCLFVACLRNVYAGAYLVMFTRCRETPNVGVSLSEGSAYQVCTLIANPGMFPRLQGNQPEVGVNSMSLAHVTAHDTNGQWF